MFVNRIAIELAEWESSLAKIVPKLSQGWIERGCDAVHRDRGRLQTRSLRSENQQLGVTESISVLVAGWSIRLGTIGQ